MAVHIWPWYHPPVGPPSDGWVYWFPWDFLMKGSANSDEAGEFVGDLRNGAIYFGWENFDEKTKVSKRAIDMNNGFACMMSILGLMVHEQLGGSVPIVGEL